VSFRREKYVPRGGPDGGRGGNGGSVVLVADASVSTLRELGRRRVYRAERGQHGKGSRRNGRKGKDVVVPVPLGTEVRLTADRVLAGNLDAVGESVVVARGGLGGKGNEWFARPDYQVPRIAQRGQAGEETEVELDLKLLADVGIVGLPNVGKSTLLQAISAARPHIADYPFTTREPVLGVVDIGFDRFVVADIPGLIEDAHRGAGLGLEFLQHIERTRVLIHLLDGTRADPVADMDVVNHELLEYGAALVDRRQVIAVNKVDLEGVRARIGELQEALAKRGLIVSIDTTKPSVAEAAIGAGASIVNDVSALSLDPAMAGVVARHGVPLILMHMRGTPKTMQLDTAYGDLMSEVYGYLHSRLEFAAQMGIDPESIIVDPGLGFGKSVEGNLELLRRLREFKSLGAPVLAGPSRKSFIGKTLNTAGPDERLAGTIAACVLAVANGAAILRVHDVKEARRAAAIADAVAGRV